MKQRSFAKTAFLMGVIILASKLMGLARDVLTARAFGTTDYAIAYETASKLPLTIFDFVLGGVVTSAFIPIYNSISVKNGKKQAVSFLSSYINLILLITLAITAFGEAFAPLLVKFIAPELSEATAALSVSLTRIMFPMVVFVGLAFSFVGFLQSEGEYNLPAVISLVSNVIMCTYLLTLSDKFGVTGLAVAMLVGWIMQALVQLPTAVKKGLKYSPKSRINTPEITRAAKNTIPILLATWTTPLCSLINTRLASGIENGRAITALGYANKLYIIIVGLFSFVATNLLFPYFSKSAAEGNRDESDRLTRTSIKTLAFIIAPISVGVTTLAEPFISLIYEKGSFTYSDTLLTAEALRCYAVGMIFSAVTEILTKAFFAAEDNKKPMYSAAIAMVVNILLVAVFGERLTTGGVALVTSAVAAVNMVLNLAFAIKTGLVSTRKNDILDIIKSVVCAMAMGAVIAVFTHFVPLNSRIGALLLPTLVGVIAYAILAAVTKSSEMTMLIDFVKSKFKRGERAE